MLLNTRTKSALILTLFTVAACSEGTAVLTGTARTPSDPNHIRLFAQPPSQPYEIIGLVSARSSFGWTDQAGTDHAIDELKAQAAALGANGVIVGRVETRQTGFVVIEDTFFPEEEQVVGGQAIFVIHQ